MINLLSMLTFLLFISIIFGCGVFILNRFDYYTCYTNMVALGYGKDNMCIGNPQNFSTCLSCPYYKGGIRIA